MGIARIVFYVVCAMSISKERVAKYISAEANARNNRTSIARQRHGKQGLSTIQTVFLWSMQSGYKGVELRVQLWNVNQRTTESEESPSLRFVTRKRLVKTMQRNSHC
jgi:hypothetical protein